MMHFLFRAKPQRRYFKPASLITALTFFSVFLSTNSIADELDDAISISQSRSLAPLISRERLVQQDPIQDVRLSPDGRYLAYHIVDDDVHELWLMDLATEQPRRLLSTKKGGQIYWSADSQYMFVNDRSRVYSVSIEAGSMPRIIFKYEKKYPYELLSHQPYYGPDKAYPDAVIVSKQVTNKDDFVLYRVKADGTQQELYRGDRIEVPLFDASGELVFFNRITETGVELVRYVDQKEHVLLQCSLVGTDVRSSCRPMKYDAEQKRLYLNARFDSDLASLYTLELESKQLIRVHSDPNGHSDSAGYRFDSESSKPILAYYEYDYRRAYGLTAEIQNQLNTMSDLVDSRRLTFEPDIQLKRWLIVDADPSRSYVRYFLYQPDTQALSQPLEYVYALLDNVERIPSDHLAMRVPVHYAVSDGMQQQGYLMLPPGVDLAKAPLIVLPHGGPWARVKDKPGIYAQILSNRGYIVFEPNFRSSTGFGAHYIASAIGEFGQGRVHQDIIDGLNYVLSQGIGDPDNLAIAGHSFGGFSVLGALAFSPELFKVGVAGAPPIDFNKTLIYAKKTEFVSANALKAMSRAFGLDMDDPESRRESRNASPDFHASKVSKPLYIWAGKWDDRVSVLNVKDYALKQRESGKSVTLMVDANSGHNPNSALAREAMFFLYEQALHKHLGGRLEETVTPELARFLKRSVLIDENSFL